MNDAATPTVELDAPYSTPGAAPTDWERARRHFAEAAIYWLSTVRADGRPHVTPVIAVWSEGAVHVCTGPQEQKAKNLAGNPHVTVTTGTNEWAGLDVVVEGAAVPVTDDDVLRDLAARWEAKYGGQWHFDVENGRFLHDEGTALVFAIAPVKAYAYDRDEPGAATRYRF
jgi:hypothetical protein